MKNLALGAAIGYRPDAIKAFVKSFRRVNEVDDVYLLVYSNIDNEIKTKEFLKEHNINYLICDKTYVKNASVNNTRYYKYLEFLEKNYYNNIFITDVRDVIFQENPFNFIKNNKFLYFFEEDRSECLGNNTYNDAWIISAFGESKLNELKNKPIICSGITFGSYDNILHYLIKMINILNVLKIQNPNAYKVLGIDQGIHNYIAYKENKSFKGFEIKELGDIVATIGITSQNNPDSITIKNNLIYLNNKLATVVHQYDRNPKLEGLINESF